MRRHQRLQDWIPEEVLDRLLGTRRALGQHAVWPSAIEQTFDILAEGPGRIS